MEYVHEKVNGAELNDFISLPPLLRNKMVQVIVLPALDDNINEMSNCECNIGFAKDTEISDSSFEPLPEEISKNNTIKEKININNIQYSILNARRDNYNNLIWNTPMLSLAALSFLFTIIFSDRIGSTELLILSVLSLIFSVFSMQLLMKHRFFESKIAKTLHQFEKQNKKNTLGEINDKINYEKQNNILKKPIYYFINISSYKFFLFIMGLFALSSCYKIFYAIKTIISCGL